MSSYRIETITTADGGHFDGYLWTSDEGSGPGILLLQEIFGVGKYLRAVAERLAGAGYTVLSPDLFWRIERNVALEHDEAGLQRGYELVGAFDFETGVSDCGAALAHLRNLSETKSRAGVLGFCLGGTLAWLVASHYPCDYAVSYYGSGISDLLGESDGVTCPMLMHFGTEDSFIPIEQVNAVRDGLSGRPNIEIVLHRAGHAFDNHEAPMFYDQIAAREAWGMTTAFLERNARGS
jgi:carboxymethylenebutenolidase